MRLLAGIYRPDAGSIQIDGQPVYENEALKQRIFYISDDQFYFPNSNMEEMAQYYAVVYQKFSWERFRELTELFRLDSRRKLNTFSKGMKKQAHIILALASPARLSVLRRNLRRFGSGYAAGCEAFAG